MSARFTPGPWEAHTFSLTTADRRHTLAHFGPIRMKSTADSTRESEANCILAAAAPELYEALVECRQTFAFYVRHHEAKFRMSSDSGEQGNLQDKIRRNQKMVDLCDAAIAKAAVE